MANFPQNKSGNAILRDANKNKKSRIRTQEFYGTLIDGLLQFNTETATTFLSTRLSRANQDRRTKLALLNKGGKVRFDAARRNKGQKTQMPRQQILNL